MTEERGTYPGSSVHDSLNRLTAREEVVVAVVGTRTVDMVDAITTSTVSEIRMRNAFEKRPVDLNRLIPLNADAGRSIPTRTAVARLAVPMTIRHDEEGKHPIGTTDESRLVEPPRRAPVCTDNNVVDDQGVLVVLVPRQGSGRLKEE